MHRFSWSNCAKSWRYFSTPYHLVHPKNPARQSVNHLQIWTIAGRMECWILGYSPASHFREVSHIEALSGTLGDFSECFCLLGDVGIGWDGTSSIATSNLEDRHTTTYTVNESTTVLPPRSKCHWRCKRAATAKPKTGRAKKTMT